MRTRGPRLGVQWVPALLNQRWMPVMRASCMVGLRLRTRSPGHARPLGGGGRVWTVWLVELLPLEVVVDSRPVRG